jgi:4-hydroxy-2-oxoheptanedioate aldolase
LLAGVTDQKVYLREANDATVTLAMIETREAMDNLDAIAAVPGIDVLFVGPSDLSITLSNGQSWDPHSAEVEAALDKIVAATKKAGKIAGLYCANAERALATAKRGFRFLAVGSDLGFLRAGLAPQVKALKGG